VVSVSATHTRDQTVAGPPQCSFEGSQTDPQPAWLNGRAGIIPFRYSPDLFEGKGTSHVRGDTGDLPSSENNTGIEPHPGHAFPTAERFVVVSCQITPAKNPSVPAYVAAGHSRRGSLRVSDAGGSMRTVGQECQRQFDSVDRRRAANRVDGT